MKDDLSPNSNEGLLCFSFISLADTCTSSSSMLRTRNGHQRPADSAALKRKPQTHKASEYLLGKMGTIYLFVYLLMSLLVGILFHLT